MTDCRCLKSFALGILIPLILCLFIYLLIGLYVLYYTYYYRSVDLNQWLNSQQQRINQIYQNQINFLNNKIDQLN